MNRRPPVSVRTRLVLLFFAITTGAVGFVYLYVVPQLSSSLTAERLERLERLAASELGGIARAAERDADRLELGSLARRTATRVEARVTLLGVRDGDPGFVIADSDLVTDATQRAYPAARGAVGSGAIRSAIETGRGQRTGQTAVPIFENGRPIWVAVLSTPLEDVEDNVSLIQRQILIAGVIALAMALLAAWFAAGIHAKRLRRLEHAAEQVSGGRFDVPIPIDSDDEVGQLAVALDGMQRRLARLDSARREFIANASHELRTPIASLGGFVELLGEEEEPDRESRREFVAVMRGQIERLTKLTTDLLDLSRIDADALEIDRGPIDLDAVVSEADGEFSAAASQRGVTIRRIGREGRKPLVQADFERTLQIMRILVDNAIKHTRPGTTIEIETDIRATECAVRVIDDGPGIPASGRDQVFERFYTADSISGSGLGLSIGRELARLMGGDLVLAGSHRGRTTFELTLPAATGAST